MNHKQIATDTGLIWHLSGNRVLAITTHDHQQQGPPAKVDFKGDDRNCWIGGISRGRLVLRMGITD
jgi:hypothetical protein